MLGTRLALGLLACVALSAQAERLPDRRQVPAPVVSTQSMVTQEQILDLLRQMESQQQELRQLRNQIEVQQHELDKLKARERNLLGDLDRRLQALETRATAPQATNASPPATNGGATAAIAPAEQQAYDAAFALMKQSQYERAIKAFRDFGARYPRSPLAGNAQYWAGEANYVLYDYKAALNEFTQLIERYPDSPKVPEAMLKIGYVQAELGQPEKAYKVLADLVRRYPGTPAAKLASKRLEGTPR